MHASDWGVSLLRIRSVNKDNDYEKKYCSITVHADMCGEIKYTLQLNEVGFGF